MLLNISDFWIYLVEDWIKCCILDLYFAYSANANLCKFQFEENPLTLVADSVGIWGRVKVTRTLKHWSATCGHFAPLNVYVALTGPWRSPETPSQPSKASISKCGWSRGLSCANILTSNSTTLAGWLSYHRVPLNLSSLSIHGDRCRLIMVKLGVSKCPRM